MKEQKVKKSNLAANAWLIVGGVAAAYLAIIVIREIPSMRRELKTLKM